MTPSSVLRHRYPDMPTLLADIRARPDLFLGGRTIAGLNVLVGGIGLAEDFHQIPQADRFGGFDFPAFERWVETRYNPHRLTLNSCSLAARLAGSEPAGFDLWFRWYDEFTADTH